MRCLSARATPYSVVTPLAWLASQAWPRLMPCFDGEASEVLIHPLGPAFNVGDDHANHLSNGHALWAAGTGVRRQKFSRVSQPRNNASAHSLVNIIPSLSTPSYPISARRHKVIRAPSVGLRLRIRIFSQESGGQEPKHDRRSGVASRASHAVPFPRPLDDVAHPFHRPGCASCTRHAACIECSSLAAQRGDTARLYHAEMKATLRERRSS
jgi:hypothetical protein